MLIAFSSFIQDEVDPDFVITFEASTINMIASRMSLHGLSPRSLLGRIRSIECEGLDQGRGEGCAHIPGRVHLVVQDLVKSEYELRSYSYESVMKVMFKEIEPMVAEEERGRMSLGSEEERASLSLILCRHSAGLLCIINELGAVDSAVTRPLTIHPSPPGCQWHSIAPPLCGCVPARGPTPMGRFRGLGLKPSTILCTQRGAKP